MLLIYFLIFISALYLMVKTYKKNRKISEVLNEPVQVIMFSFSVFSIVGVLVEQLRNSWK